MASLVGGVAAMLPNVIPALNSFSLNGKSVIVKNTFVDVAEAGPREQNHRRSKSVPLAWRAGLQGLDDEQWTPVDESLHEVRRRVFTNCGELERLEDFINLDQPKVEDFECIKPAAVDPIELAETCSQASTQLPSSVAGVQTERCDRFGAAEIGSEASTQVPCSSVGTRARFLSELTDTAVRVPLCLHNFVSAGFQAYPASVPAAKEDNRTTLMFRNLPEWFTRQKLEALLNAEGFGMLYDFIYLPAELGSGNCFGYAFINMVTPHEAERFVEYFQGFDRWPQPDARRAVVHLSEALQGLDEQIERYRNSPLMHPSVADDLRPAVYSRGIRMRFPEPTVPIRPPRVRTSTKKKGPLRAASKSDL